MKSIMAVHEMLDECFFEHQRALLHFEFDKALDLLKTYESHLRKHMRDEEEILLPLYVERCDFPPAGDPKLYIDNHKKMLSYVRLFLDKIADLPSETDSDKSVLAILDRESFFLRLCSHHDKREAEFMYPLLDQAMTNSEKQSVLASLDLKPLSRARVARTG